MAKKPIPSPELLRQLLRYDPDTGKLHWKTRPASMFEGLKRPADVLCRAWNGRLAGREAFTHIGNHGYPNGAVGNTLLLAHRVIWAMVHNEWPEHEIDHDNGKRSDNRLSNLIAKTHGQNLKNAAGKCTNRSGANGVSWRPNRGKWRARIMVDGKEIHLGQFDDFDDALAARNAASVKYGFTARHGELRADGA